MSESTQWVVYIFDDEDARPMQYFLDVCDDRESAYESMKKWWRAFDTGKKGEPDNYGGVSFAPVSDFDEWESGDTNE